MNTDIFVELRSDTMPSDASNKISPTEAYLHKLSGQEKDPDVALVDHTYARPWNAHPDSSHAKPARLLFMKGLSRHSQLNLNRDNDLEIDVETVPNIAVPPYDNAKTRLLMNECERFVQESYVGSSIEERDDHIRRVGWSGQQNRLFNKVLKILQTDRLARLAYDKVVNEPVKRRIAVDKTSKRIRQIFTSLIWDMKLLHWLHSALVDNLNSSLLGAYFDVLQTLKSKIPTMIDKMLSQHVHSARSGFSCCSSTDTLHQLVKRHWDPVLPSLNYHRSRKLPNCPLIVITPSGPNQHSVNQSRRMKFWHSQLNSLGRIINVSFHAANGANGVSVDQCLEHIVGAVRTKVLELKSHFPDRPIVLVGWTVGALIACHVALAESLTAVICLGFPLTGVNGSRGDLDDPLLECRVPTLFVIGQCSHTCSMDDMEDFRERMKAETGLVVVGGADDMLRVSHMKKKLDNVTQVMVDRCIVDEVGEFLGGILNQPISSIYISPSRIITQENPECIEDDVKQKKRKSKDISPDSSPVKKRPRQNSGRMNPLTSKAGSSSSSSSDSSSSGSGDGDKNTEVESAPKKKRSGRKIGRPPGSVFKKRQISKNFDALDTTKVNSATATKKPEELKTNRGNATSLEKVTASSPAPSQGFSLNIGSFSSLGKFNQSKILGISNERRNDPVDVEKAFGRDSSFLPRPLTPSEPEGNIPSVISKSPGHGCNSPIPMQTEHAMSDSLHEKFANSPHVSVVANSLVGQSSPKQKFIAVPSTSLSNILSSVNPPKISYIKQSSLNINNPAVYLTDSKPSSGTAKSQIVVRAIEPIAEPDREQVEAIQKLQYHDFPLTTASLIGNATNNAPTITQAKILASGGLNLKHLQKKLQASIESKGLLSASNTLQTQTTSSNSCKTSTLLLSSPNLESTALLVSNPGKALPTKSIQVQGMILKGSMTPTKIQMPLLSKLVTPAKCSLKDGTESTQSVDTQACNLSLLSDVAGMKEPIKEALKKHDLASSSHATLVKLAPERGVKVREALMLKTGSECAAETIQLSQLKRLHFYENVSSQIKMPSPPTRLETQEELIEKQMAIQALSKSIADDAESSSRSMISKEPGYSICYTNPDGSVISRTVSGPSYSVNPPSHSIRGSRATRAGMYSRSAGRGRGVTSAMTSKMRVRNTKPY